ncbi:Uncharacterized conserved protein (DUF2347) [Geosmithia morbida]|uniref:Uncharacterized conserved protein (DUF2347) n=1 Tax=Geosmithia morbida TaxID=1094350 RepID=A0A9P4YLP3_9HYPO|nr:Uncharacterized conserved protein (DUF2347) [Geosmithia morbida]KAF4119271.1 Uncharacterized conserved protein (DUF2347) [Geosmithia morbida]
MTSQATAQSSGLGAAAANACPAHLLPPIDALFLIDFDVKKGYTIAWKRTCPGVDVDGRVEYKSLPSGLHTVSEDLIYFVHDGAHAGLSAFVNVPCDEEEARNARMISVGILVPLSYGRLGRAWKHAQGLKDLAAKLAKNLADTTSLEAYWEANRPQSDDGKHQQLPPFFPESPIVSSAPAVTFSEPASRPKSQHSHNRSTSDGAPLAPAEYTLSAYHPAWSLTRLLDKFGPLVFPIHRAALLRRRILISCHAPVHEVCDFVYNLSVLSNIPHSLANVLPQSSSSAQRLRPLFAIGVHDVPFLVDDYDASKRRGRGEDVLDELGTGWIACTTDSILAMKDTLWDMLITMPPDHAVNAKDKAWPVVECPRGKPVKATQRDLRRYNTLRSGLARFSSPSRPASASGSSPARQDADSRSQLTAQMTVADDSFDAVTEPLSWTALAYNGYMWWASAGEQRLSEEQEEHSHDAALLADLMPPSPGQQHQASVSLPRHQQQPPSSSSSRADPLSDSTASLTARHNTNPPSIGGSGQARVELATIAYFHRLTTQILSIVSDIVDSAEDAYPPPQRPLYSDDVDGQDDGDDDDENAALVGASSSVSAGDDDDDDDDGAAVVIDSRSMEKMGLDVWSDSDAEFVRTLTKTYFGRKAKTEGKGVEVCGVRVC